MSVSKERQDLASLQLTFQSNDLEFTAMLLFSSQCAAAHLEMSDKLGASFDAWEKKMFSIPSTHISSEYFSSYSSGSFDLTLFLFWFKGRGKKPTGLFNYLSQKAFKTSFQSWFLDFYTHSCTLGSWSDLLGGELSEGQKMCLTDTWDVRHSDSELCPQAVARSTSVMEGAAGKLFQPPDSSVWTLTSTTLLAMKEESITLF